MKKVISLSESRDEDEVLPVDFELLLRHLKLIKADFADEYGKAILANVEEHLLFKSLVDARESFFLFRHHVEQLTPSQFNRMLKIALHLSSVDPMSRIAELVKETFGTVIPSAESLSRAMNLVAAIQAKTKVDAMRLKKIGDRYRFLSDMTLVLGLEEAYYDIVVDRLSTIPQSDIDELAKLL